MLAEKPSDAKTTTDFWIQMASRMCLGICPTTLKHSLPSCEENPFMAVVCLDSFPPTRTNCAKPFRFNSQNWMFVKKISRMQFRSKPSSVGPSLKKEHSVDDPFRFLQPCVCPLEIYLCSLPSCQDNFRMIPWWYHGELMTMMIWPHDGRMKSVFPCSFWWLKLW